MAGFASAVIPQTLTTLSVESGLLWQLQSSAFTAFTAVLALVSQWGICLLIFAVPKFVLSHLDSEKGKKGHALFFVLPAGLAAALTLDSAFFLLPVDGPFGIISPWITLGIWVLFFVSIVYALAHFLKKGRPPKTKEDLMFSLLFCAGGFLLIVFQWIFTSSERLTFIILPGFYLFLIRTLLQAPSKEVNRNVLKEKGISAREEEVVKLLVKGLSYKEIAGELFISLPTVQSHIGRIYRKTGVNSKIELINLLNPED